MQGSANKFIQYFLNIDHFFKQHPLRIIRVDEIRCCKLSKLKQHYDFKDYKLFVVDNKTIGIFDEKRDINVVEIEKNLKIGVWLISK